VQRAYLASTRALGVLLAAVGITMVATTVARGGGPLAFGVILGVLFAGLGVARVILGGARGGERNDA
jgi:hypothetical protein